MSTETNTRIVLASRPQGRPKPDDFRIESVAVAEPGEGELLLQILYLSLDPYMRGRMNAAKSYAKPVEIDGVMEGGTVARVVRSRNAGFAEGDIVLSHSGWQGFALSDGVGLRKLDPAAAPLTTALGVLGMPGFTAYAGLLTIGQPKAGETVVVAAASGAVGSAVGQIARIKGARAVGIAGGADKCAFVRQELGFDAVVDHRAENFAEQLKAACPDGIDIYFENVGGPVWDAVFPLLNEFARVPVCGLIAQYNTIATSNADRLPTLMQQEPDTYRIITPPFTKVFQGMAFTKSNTVLQAAVLDAVKKLFADGTYGKLIAKWKLEASAAPAPSVNGEKLP